MVQLAIDRWQYYLFVWSEVLTAVATSVLWVRSPINSFGSVGSRDKAHRHLPQSQDIAVQM